MRFLARRARAQAALLAVLAALVAVITAAAVAGSGLVVERSGAITTTELTTRQGAAGALVLQTRAGVDPQAQDALVSQELERLVREHGGGPDDVHALQVTRTWVGESLTLQRDGDAVGSAFLAVATDPREDVELVAGQWLPGTGAESGNGDDSGTENTTDSAVPALLPAAAADRAGLVVGDRVTVGSGESLDLQILGTYAPLEPSAPRWTASGSSQLTGESSQVGPFLLAEEGTIPGDPFLRWTITPSGIPLRADGAAPLASAVAELPAHLADDEGFAPRGLTQVGALGQTLQDLADAAADARAVTWVALVMLVIIGVLCLSQVARLLARARAPQTMIMLARGAAPGRLVAMEVIETSLVTAVAVALGVALGLTLAPGGAVVGLLALPLAWAAMAWPAVSAVLRPEGTGRGMALVQGASAGLIVLLAGFSTWRLLALSGAESRTALDAALALPAPGLAVLAASLVLLLVLAPVWAGMDRQAGRSPLTVALGLWSLARSSRAQAVPVLLLAAAVGTSGVAATYAASAGQARTDLVAAQAGADARVLLPTRSAISAAYPQREITPLAEVPGVAQVARVNRVPGSIGGVEVSLLAVPASDLAEVMTGTELDELTVAIAPDSSVDAVSDPISALTLRLAQSGGTTLPPDTTAQLTTRAWVADEEGRITWQEDVQEVTLGTVQVELPESGDRLLALDASVRLPQPVQEVTLSLEAVQGASPDGWQGTSWSGQPGEPVISGAWASALQGRLVPPSTAAVPAVLSPALAESLDASVGDALEVSGSGFPLGIEVTGIAEVPGAPGATVLVDREEWVARTAAWSRGIPDADEVWLALQHEAGETAEDEAVLRSALAQQARLLDGTVSWPDLAAAGTAVGTPAFVLVAAAALVLAVVGLLAAALVSVRARRSEVVTLRAVGLPARRQARARALEPLVVTAAGILGGVLVAVAVSAVVAPALVRLSVPEAAAITLHVQVWWMLAALAVLGLGGVLTSGVVARTVVRQARDTDHREETR